MGTKMLSKTEGNNQLEMIVRDSGMEIESPKAKMLLEQFSDYFNIAADWEAKAKILLVTDASQITEMKMAREGRLFLRKKRIAIEKTRKELKEQSLREGKAIDGMANILKALIVPIEEHLDKQEHFVEIKQAEETERLKVEAERKDIEERLAKEKAEAEERERVRLENIRLQEEAKKRERELAAAHAKVEKEKAKAEAEKHKQKEKLARQKADAEDKRQKAESKKQKELAKIEVERKSERKRAVAEKARAEKEKARIEAERQKERAKVKAERVKVEAEHKKQQAEMEAKLKTQITCPHCGKKLYPDGSC